ncbi:MAG: hypothetical protein Q8Q85_16625 [Gemmatimonadales bacterium]|nr:hypothetical protein [Gemmatimonadales bacterium]
MRPSNPRLRWLAVVVLAAAALPSPLRSQTLSPTDSVRLTDGRIIHGQIVSFDGTTLVIRTSEGVQSHTRNGLLAIFIAHTGDSSPELPPGISAGTGLQVARWTTFRQITRFERGADFKSIHSARLSPNGAKIIFGANQGVYTINPDGTGLVRVGEAPDVGLVDISADGRRIAYFSRQEGLMTAMADGTNKERLPAPDVTLTGLRITARGDRVFVLAPQHGDQGGILELTTNGDNVRRVITTTQVARATGIDDNGNYWRGFPESIDISDDGSRGVARYLHEAIAFTGDGRTIRQLVNLPYEGTYPGAARISGDGRKVMFLLNRSSDGRSVHIMDFDGTNRVSYSGQHTEGTWAQMSPNGNTALVSGGIRLFNADGQSFQDISDPGRETALFEGPQMVSMAADWKRGVMVIDGPISVDQGRPSQLVVFELNPTQLNGTPTIANVTAAPRFLPTDGSSSLTLRANSSATDPRRAGSVFFRENQRPTVIGLERPYSHGLRPVAGSPGSYTNQLSLSSGYGGDVGAGPLMLRIFIQDKEGRTTIIDVAGIEARRL